MWWCMECAGKCNSGDAIMVWYFNVMYLCLSHVYLTLHTLYIICYKQIDFCGSSSRQKFGIYTDGTIRPSNNKNLCIETWGTTESKPIRLQSCDGGSDQKFEGMTSNGIFKIRPSNDRGRCLTQQHHPKAWERVYPHECDKAERDKTVYWHYY